MLQLTAGILVSLAPYSLTFKRYVWTQAPTENSESAKISCQQKGIGFKVLVVRVLIFTDFVFSTQSFEQWRNPIPAKFHFFLFLQCLM